MMSTYREQERKRQSNLLKNGFFGHDAGSGYYLKKGEGVRNLFESIRTEALEYFERYGIAWWRQDEDGSFPTGHLLSSQICCLNHLFALRKDSIAVLEMIRPIGQEVGIEFDQVLPSFIDNDGGYIAFEFVCHNRDLLKESHEKRGAKCTSVDALIYAQAGKEKWLIPIEWKYTESYSHDKKAYSFARYETLVTKESRINNWEGVFAYDPFYELGRQNILMEQIICHKPLIQNGYQQSALEADNFLHLLIVPETNHSMREDAESYISLLKKESRRYTRILSPQTLLANVLHRYPSLARYLEQRYWVL